MRSISAISPAKVQDTAHAQWLARAVSLAGFTILHYTYYENEDASMVVGDADNYVIIGI
jgi:hypothetical protein